jgi:hypothetical protein
MKTPSETVLKNAQERSEWRLQWKKDNKDFLKECKDRSLDKRIEIADKRIKILEAKEQQLKKEIAERKQVVEEYEEFTKGRVYIDLHSKEEEDKWNDLKKRMEEFIEI